MKQDKEKAHKEHKTLPRAMWKGTISFGLVNIPVRLYAALQTKDIRFHMLHRKDNSRIEQRIVCSAEQKEISRDETVKGYEISPGQYVIIQTDELNTLAPKASRTIELIQFVDIKEIDPIYYDRPYYLIPEETSEKAYHLFVEAIQNAGKAGLAKFVMRNKEYAAILRPIENVVYLETIHFPDEVILADEIKDYTVHKKASEGEVKMAQQLIDSLSRDFDPESLRDEYRDAVLDLIRKKAEGKEVAIEPVSEEEGPEVVDLMEALKASLEQVKKEKTKKKKAA